MTPAQKKMSSAAKACKGKKIGAFRACVSKHMDSGSMGRVSMRKASRKASHKASKRR